MAGSLSDMEPSSAGTISLALGLISVALGFFGFLMCPPLGLVGLLLALGGLYTGYKAISTEEGMDFSSSHGTMGLIGAIASVIGVLFGGLAALMLVLMIVMVGLNLVTMALIA